MVRVNANFLEANYKLPKVKKLGISRRVVTYAKMTPKQRSIIDAGREKGTAVPENLSGDDLVNFFMQLAEKSKEVYRK